MAAIFVIFSFITCIGIKLAIQRGRMRSLGK